jgi:VWFA-related protein
MGRLSFSLSLALLLAPIAMASAQDPQAPVFRSGVDVLEVDVNIVDSAGRPIGDLRAPDFNVTVDGQPRTIASSLFIRDDSSDPAAARYKADPYVASNTDRPRGRLIIVAIDQNNITTGRARDLMTSVRKFVEALPGADRVALVALPAPGPAVDFTANRQRIYEALPAIRGVDDGNLERYDIGDQEAIAVVNHGDEIVIRRLLERECGSVTDQTCISDIELEASRIAQRIRTRANESFYALGGLLRNLKEVEGSKSMLFISQGFVFDDPQAKAAALAAVAADARVNLNVILLTDIVGDASSARSSATVREDRELRQQGLEALAARSRGALFDSPASTEIALGRVLLEMSGHYLLGVEPAQKDRDGKVHQIRVQVKRKGATVRSRREFQYAGRTSDRRPREEQIISLLRSPATATDLPMRLASYVFQDPESYKEKLLLAVEIDPTVSGPADLMVGFVVFDSQGRAVTNGRERKIFTLGTARTAQYDAAITIEPGTYTVRFAAIDLAGNRGSLEHAVKVFQMSTENVAVGDLMLAGVQAGSKGALRPVVTARVDNGLLAVFTEFYSNRKELLDGVSVVMEVATDESAPAVLREEGVVQPRAEGAGRQASALMPVGELEPGKYFGRAIISMGGQVVGKVSRPFVIEPSR